MPDLSGLLEQMRQDGAFVRIARNRAAQFGTGARPRLGAEFLPAVNQEENAYTDDTVKYRTVVANAGTRYSPVVLKRGAYVGSVKVEMFEMDLGSELTSREYDALLRYLDRDATMEATAQIVRFVNTTVNEGMEELREVYRWQCIESALVKRRGANGFKEDIKYSNPAGHRATAAAAWSNSANDPMVDIFNRVQLLKSKGYTVNRIITTMNVVNILSLNDKMRTRAGAITVNVGGGLVVQGGMANRDQINQIFRANGLPALELYDEVYRHSTGTARFISNDVMIFISTTGRSEEIILDETSAEIQSELLTDTLGYYGVGRASGQSDAGRVIIAEHIERKPPRIEAEGWETSAPVITEPEAIATITGIA